MFRKREYWKDRHPVGMISGGSDDRWFLLKCMFFSYLCFLDIPYCIFVIRKH